MQAIAGNYLHAMTIWQQSRHLYDLHYQPAFNFTGNLPALMVYLPVIIAGNEEIPGTLVLTAVMEYCISSLCKVCLAFAALPGDLFDIR